MATTSAIASALASAASIGNSFGLFGGGGDKFDLGDNPEFFSLFFGPALADTIASTIFGGDQPLGTETFIDPGLFQNIFQATDIFRRALPVDALELAGFSVASGGPGPSFINQAAQGLTNLGEVARETATEAARTGFRTDVAPLFEAIRQNRLPQLEAQVAERFGSLGRGGSARDFALASEVLRPLAELEAQLGFQASEAAAGRRLQAPLGEAARLTGLPAEFRLGAAQDLLNIGKQRRIIDELRRPFARAFLGFPELGVPSTLPTFLNLSTAQRFFSNLGPAGTFPSGNFFSTGGANALVDSLPALAKLGSSLGKLFGGGDGQTDSSGGGEQTSSQPIPDVPLPFLENIQPRFPSLFDLNIDPGDFGFGSPQSAAIVNLSSSP